jgi:hypothetical protein
MELELQSALQFWAGFYERETYRWLRQFAAGHRSGIDVGAAWGEFTLYLLRSNQDSNVIAFDPDPKHEPTFTRNLKMNGFSEGDRLQRYRKFVGTGTNGTVRLDAFESHLKSPVFLRVDVDGHEMDVLQGASGLLQNKKVRLIFETHSATLEQNCECFLKDLGYRTKIIKNAWWRIVIKDQRPIELNRWLVASNDPNCAIV